MTYRADVMKNCPGFATDTMEKKLCLGGLGVAGEAGEVADLVKKILHHRTASETVEGKTEELRDKLIKEMGDVYWYLEYLCATLNIDRENVMHLNTEKLKLRHKNGWTPESQQAKADEK